jgi:hypothetical protein
MEYLTPLYNGAEALFVEDNKSKLLALQVNIREKLLTDYANEANSINAKLNEISAFITSTNPFIVTISNKIQDIIKIFQLSEQEGGKRRRNLRGGQLGEIIGKFFMSIFLILVFLWACLVLSIEMRLEDLFKTRRASPPRISDGVYYNGPNPGEFAVQEKRDPRGGKKKSKQSKKRRTVKRR